MKRALAAVALVLAVTTAHGALAAGRRDQWDVARAPDERKNEEAFQTARTILEQATVTRSPLMRHDFAATARSMLEELGAEKSSDPRLRFALGHALHWLDDDARVIAVLRPAVDEFATHPDVHVALFDLAVSYARTNRSRDEILMYDRALELEARPDVRHTILSNRAEAKLKIGLIDDAIEDYRTSIALFPDQPLPRWGLAVAWDRAGNFSEAIAEARRAKEVDSISNPSLDRSGVFFVPDYERFWYYALREAVWGTTAELLADRKEHWETAAHLWENYLARATSDDRWVPLAKARKRLAEASAAKLAAELKRGGERKTTSPVLGKAKPPKPR